MKYDEEKIDEIVLALLYLTSEAEEYVTRAWKSQDWGVLNRLHEKGFISDPKTKARSVALSEEGSKLSKELFIKHFGIKE